MTPADIRNGTLDDAKRAADADRVEERARQLLLEDEAKKLKAQLQRGPVPVIRAYRGDELPTVTFPPRKPILTRDGQTFFAAGEIGEIFSTRGFGKTWFLMTIALAVANGKNVMGFGVPASRPVLYVDGEMARQDIQERYQALCDRTGLKMTETLVIVAADWQDEYLPRIDTSEGQQAIERVVEPAELIIFDNRSCLFDAEGEKDPSAWQPTQDYLLSLRRRAKGVLLGHHANRQGGARGLGKPEDIMNLVMKLSRPDDYKPEEGARFICDCSPPDGKLRSVFGAAAAPFGLWLGPTGWTVEAAGGDPTEAAIRQKLIDYLRLAEAAGDPPKSANQALKNVSCNRDKGLRVFADMRTNGEIVGDKKIGFTVGVIKPNPFLSTP